MKLSTIACGLLLLVNGALSGCQDFEELEVNPNQPTNVPPSLVVNGVLNAMYEGAWNEVMRWNQFYALNYNYYGNQEYTWTATGLRYTTLKDVTRMELEAARTGLPTPNQYSAMGKFFRAYYYVQMTQRVGDLPLTEAVQGLANLTPIYDSQKAVYLQCLTWLDEANTELAALAAVPGTRLEGDIYFNGDLVKWQRTVNTFKLRVLISLSKKAADPDLRVPQRFAEMLADPTRFPVMTGMSDNLQYVYNTSFNKYPRNPDNFGNNATRENMAATYLNKLVELRDPRTFVVAEPAAARLATGLSATDYAAYVGASSGEDLAEMSTKALRGEYSFSNRQRYASTYTGEPTFIIGYPELCFNIAEGLHRGWATGNANTYYQQGITASMGFYGITNVTDYLAQPAVTYANNPAGLEKILQQKYLAFFQNSGWEAFYNQRRTGVPTFLTGPGTGNSGRIPRRWQYPTNERTTNAANYQDAVQRQFEGQDDINRDLWLLQ
ncbi:SusD/RagB family nutrient-binding outer membrane lipoprotein [Hymenobacter sp.]|jgi:hypothetical protein|uniref:SusD/RagB family nutrient-binding outer membrane lipoprotein n=1 Tax=Hymenobacter sp. TaxID=1898978 RepID=UPI002EDB439D